MSTMNPKRIRNFDFKSKKREKSWCLLCFCAEKGAKFWSQSKSCFNYDGLGDLEFDSVSLSHEKAGWWKEKKRTKKIPPQKACIWDLFSGYMHRHHCWLNTGVNKIQLWMRAFYLWSILIEDSKRHFNSFCARKYIEKDRVLNSIG